MEIITNPPVFFTATIRNWKNLLKPEKYKNIILQKLQSMVEDGDIILYAYCIMNNHIHIIWQVREKKSPSEVQKNFLESTAKDIKKDLIENHPMVLEHFVSSQKDRSYHFWKRRPLSIELYSPDVFDQKLDYIHENPVKSGICENPEEYSFSSAGYYLNGQDSWKMITHHNFG